MNTDTHFFSFCPFLSKISVKYFSSVELMTENN